MDSPQSWARHIRPTIHHIGVGQYPELDRALESLPVPVLRDLHRLLRDVEQKIHTAEHTFRPFPGGPKIRM